MGHLWQFKPLTRSSKELHGSLWEEGIWSLLMPSLSFAEASVNKITTKEIKVKCFLGPLQDTSAQNMKARASLGECTPILSQ